MLEQTSRQIKLYTPLEDNRLVFKSMRMGAELGRLFGMQLEFYSDDGSIPYHDVLGHMVSVTLDRSHGAPACFTGYVSRFGFAGSRGRRYIYRATAVPWLWMLTQTEDCRIFHRKTTPEILREVFEQNGYTDFEFQLQKEYPAYEYCVQYRESDFNFVSRLLEREGIYYYFTHEVDRHCLVLTDAMNAHEPVPGDETYEYFARDDYSQRRRECVYAWHPEERVKPGLVSLRDYNFKKPGADMAGDAAIQRAHGSGGMSGGMEIYDYPGLYTELSGGRAYAKTRIEEQQTQQVTVRAECNLRGVEVGRNFSLIMHPIHAYNDEYLVTSAQYELYADDYESGGDETETFRCTFTALKSDEVFRPARSTQKPLIAGPQTATVVGEDEIDCDEYGRILVLFHWDREEAISMRCRVSQNWSGNTWGGMVIPRVGMEVVVEFLEGDPDQPLVTGCVYNGRNAVPYPLPEHKTKSVFRSDSHNSTGFNEFSFEDATGRENIALHAQKDQTLKVLNNRMKRVDNDQVESVGSNKAIHVEKNHQEKVDGSMNLTIGGGSPLGLFGALGGVVAAGGQDALAGSEAVGNPAISKFVGTLATAGAAAEMAVSGPSGSFDGAGNNRAAAGAEQAGTGTTLGGLLSSVMPMPGVQTTMVEKFVSDTVGLARTEQIGTYKNTSVGHTMTTHVGKEFIINCGKSKFIMDSDGNVTIIGTKFNFSASGHVQINGKVIDLN